MQSKADQWEDEIAALQDNYQTLIDEVRCARDEQAIERAASERALIEDGWLH